MNRSENSENMTTETPWCRTQFVSHGGISSTPGLDCPEGGNIFLPFVVDWYRLHWNKVHVPDTCSTLVTSFCGATQQRKGFEKRRIIQIILKAVSVTKQSTVNGPAQEIQFLGLKRQGRCDHISGGVINKITTKKTETQDFLGVVFFWRMHIPGFNLISTGYSLPLYWVTWKNKDFKSGAEQQQTFEQTKWPVQIWQVVKNVLYTTDRDNGSFWNIWPKEPGETLSWPLGFRNGGYGGSEAYCTPTEKEILATYEGIWASSEVVGTEAQLLLVSVIWGQLDVHREGVLQTSCSWYCME